MKSIQTIGIKRWAVLIFYLATIVMNFISQTLPFNGQTNGEVSDKYSTLITPADYAFSIWGIIFLALGIYAFFQAFSQKADKRIYDQVSIWLIVAFVCTSLWLPAFQYEMIALSALIMLAILGSLIQVSIMLTQDRTMALKEKAWVRIPVGLYLGWISVATLVNLSVLAKYGGWYLLNFSEVNWLLIMITVSLVLALLITKATGNLVISLVFVWAYVAIAVRHSDENAILQCSLGAAIILFIYGIMLLVRQLRKQQLMLS